MKECKDAQAKACVFFVPQGGSQEVIMKKCGKRVLAFGMASLLGGLTMGCGSGGSSDAGSAQADAGELNLIIWTEYLPEDLVEKFEEETGIQVNITYYSSSDEMVAKVTSSPKDTYDIICDGVQYYNAFRSEGIIDEIDTDRLKNIGNIGEQYRYNETYDPEGKYGIPYMGAGTVIAVNTDVIKDDITGYKDLLNPEYKDMIVSVEDARAVVGMGLMAQGYNINDTSDEALAAAQDFLDELKPNIHAFNGDSPKTLMINGECPIGYIYAAECALAQEENPAIQGIWPEEGVYFGFDELSITKEGKNIDNAYKFLDFIMDAENSAYISKCYPYFNPNTAATELLGEEYTSNPMKVIPDDVFSRVEYLTDIGEDASKIVDIMNNLKM